MFAPGRLSVSAVQKRIAVHNARGLLLQVRCSVRASHHAYQLCQPDPHVGPHISPFNTWDFQTQRHGYISYYHIQHGRLCALRPKLSDMYHLPIKAYSHPKIPVKFDIQNVWLLETNIGKRVSATREIPVRRT